jgi:hypothetical protein
VLKSEVRVPLEPQVVVDNRCTQLVKHATPVGENQDAASGRQASSGAAQGAVGVTETTHGVAGVIGAARGALGGVSTARGRKPGGTTGVTQRGAVETMSGGVESSELVTSLSMAVHGTVDPARRGVPMVGTTGASSENKKSRLLVGWGEAAKGKTASSKTTCREIMRRFVERSRQR